MNQILTILLFITLAGCARTPVQEYDPRKAAGPKQKVFENKYDQVWRAVQLALSNYPVRVNDMDSGVLETDFIRGQTAWVSPHRKQQIPSGLRYKVIVRVLKGKMSGGKAIQVTILKRIEFQKDFFSRYSPVKTDGLEEIAILYRIERELLIQRALEKAKF